MALSTELISQFAKLVVKDEPRPESITVIGTAKQYNGKIYVQIDGSNGQLTPIASSTVGMKDGDRVTVQIKNHSATVTGNATDPSAGTSYADDLQGQVDDVSDQISEFEIVIADKVDADVVNALSGRIDDLVSENVTITGELTAVKGDITDLTAKDVEITGKLTAAEADIDQLESSKADITVLESQYATIANLEATNADLHNLEADYAAFEQATANDFAAVNADIINLETNKLDAESADIRYAKIDFANIGEAAVETLFSKSGIIGDLVVSEGHITGHLVGVTISGDLIEGNTIKADKLVVLGDDGLYYKLNVSGESVAAEQTQYNSLNGSIITANTITAEKINVDDLVAFNATIGGFKLTESSIYSGVKSSVSNTTPGMYMDDTGQFAVGDQSNYLKFFKDTDGSWKLQIAASAIKMGTSSTTLEQTIEDLTEKADAAIKSTVEQFYQSTSPTALSGGTWATTQPTWQDGKYIWRRTLVTYNDGTTAYTPSENGVCITGNTGPQGDNGTSVTITSTAVTYASSTSGTTAPSSGWVTSIPSVSPGNYLWTKTVVTYSDGKSTTSYSVGRIGEDGSPGSAGTSVTVTSTATTYNAHTSGTSIPTDTWSTSIPTVPQGQYLWTRVITTYSDDKTATSYSVARQGSDGSDGTSVSITSTSVTYQAGTSGTTVPTGNWSTSVPSVSAGQYLWTKTVVNYSGGKSTTSYSVGRMGQNGSSGDDGRGIESTAITYQAHSSQTSAPTGTWSSSVPTLSTAKPYLWTRTVITYTDDTSSTSYSVGSTLDGVEFGGRNLLLNSSFNSTLDGGWTVYGTGTVTVVPGLNGNNAVRITRSEYTGTIRTGLQGENTLFPSTAVSEGETYVLSAKVKVITALDTSNNAIFLRINSIGDNPSIIIPKSPELDTWIRYESDPFTITQDATIANFFVLIGKNGSIEVSEIKLERGNKATDWTPAPEDVQGSIDYAQDTANQAKDAADANAVAIQAASASIELLQSSIQSLVTDENGASLMTQTSDGWTFNIGGLQSDVEAAATAITSIQGNISEVQSLANATKDLADDLVEKTAYINMRQDDEGDPVLELGRVDSQFKVRISNDSIDFMEGTERIAYITNRQLYIQSSVVTDEMKIGATSGFVWRKRGNGNMGLRWVAG